MLRYYAAAAALKAVSTTPLTRRLYRRVGNVVGARKRARGAIPSYYFSRIERMLRQARTYGMPRDGARLLEFGTGWLHWEAITTRLFFDVKAVLFDVWDNRQLAGLKHYINELEPRLEDLTDNARLHEHARMLIKQISQVTSHEELYNLLGFTYVVEPSGRLDSFEANAFDLVVSAGVMEHISAKDAPDFVHDIAHVLKPGGYSVQGINIRDHLAIYDKSVPRKQYLRYPEWIWRLCFDNKVQYINRLQRSDWLDLFERAGLTLVEEAVEQVPLPGARVAKRFQTYEEDDLKCGGLKVVHRKPLDWTNVVADAEGARGSAHGKTTP